MSALEKFDQMCDELEVKPEEQSEAFAAFLQRQYGWNGTVRRIDPETGETMKES